MSWRNMVICSSSSGILHLEMARLWSERQADNIFPSNFAALQRAGRSHNFHFGCKGWRLSQRDELRRYARTPLKSCGVESAMTVHHMFTEPSCSVFKGCRRLWASPNTRVCRLGPIEFHRSRSLSQWRRGSVIAVTICLGDGVTNGNKCVSSANDLWVSSCLCTPQVKQTDQAEGGGGRGINRQQLLLLNETSFLRMWAASRNKAHCKMFHQHLCFHLFTTCHRHFCYYWANCARWTRAWIYSQHNIFLS